MDNSAGRKTCKGINGIKATAKDNFSSGSEPVKHNAKQSSYHPSEDIGEPELMENEEAQLKPAECTRTIIEVKILLQKKHVVLSADVASDCCYLFLMI